MLQFKNITISNDGKPLFENLSFEVQSGEKVVLTGKSGSGKSSLLSLLLGFIEPDSGTVIFNGMEVNEKNVWEIRKNISYIDQNASLGGGNALEKIHSVTKFKANSHLRFSDKEINELLNYFELPREVVNKNADDLSGGEKQRLAIVISLLLKRKVFLLDEITSALDESLKNKTADYFTNGKDYTCLIVSHDSVWFDKPSVKIFDLDERKWRQ